MLKRYKIKIPIIRKNYTKTKSFKFKGDLYVISNIHGVIYDWKIEFKTIHLDLFTTQSWFTKKNANFDRREILFKTLNLKQFPRPKKTDNKIIKLDPNQVLAVNNFFNNRKTYSSTIKNIIPILKGNNPGGEAKNPKSAEMILDTNNSIENFVILLDDLIMKNKNKVLYDVVNIAAEEIHFNEFVKLNESISSAFKYMQDEKDMKSWSNYLSSIKEYYNKFNTDIAHAYAIAKKSRSQFGIEIDKKIQKFPFGFVSKDQFIKCHIFEFHNIRDLIVEAIRTNKSYKKYVHMISDPNNFLPLPDEIHRKFDSDFFTYKLNGDIWPLHEQGKDYVEKYIKSKFYKIPEFFLTKERKKYLELRNHELFF